MRMFLRTLLLPFVGMLLCTLTAATNAKGQTLTTDKADYPPGSTVYITGTGFAPNDSVTMRVIHVGDDLDNATSPDHQPWTITADADGNIAATWYVPTDQDEVGATLLATADQVATDLHPAFHAEATFTDAGNASDGDGTMVVTPTSACAGSSGNTFTFTFTAPNGKDFNAGSALSLTIAPGWPAPNAGNTAVVAGTGTTVSAPSFSGQVITVNMTCPAGKSFTITYSGIATPSSPTGANPFTTKTKQSGGTLTNIGTSPIVTLTPTVGTPTAITVSSGTQPACQLTNGTTTTTYATTATNNTGFNWSLSNPSAGSINSSGVMTWANGFTGTVDIQVTANGCNGPSSQVVRTVTVNPTVGTPTAITISSGTEPTCQLTNGTTTTTYATTATNSTGFNWSLSNPSAGSINPSSGVMTWANGFSGSVNIQVTANGCNGPSSQVVRSVSITPTVGTPTAITVSSGTQPTCQLTNGTTTTTYATTATNNTGLNWSLSNPSAGSINPSSGVMTWANGFSGSVNIQVTANGCNGPSSQVVRTVTVTPTVGTPTAITISSGTEPTCQLTNGTTTTTYATTATNNTGFNWSLSNPSAGSINPSSGVMTWANGFSGSVNIQVTANGCNGPSSQVVRAVTVNPRPTATASPASQTVCSGDVATISLSSSLGGTTYAWLGASSPAPNVTVSPSSGTSNPISATLTNNTGAGRTVTFTVTPTAAGCAGTAITPTVLVKMPLTTANAGLDQTVSGTSTSLTGNAPGGGETGSWVISNGTGGNVVTPSSPTSTFTGVAGNTYILTWTISNGICSSSDDVTITFNNPCTAPVVTVPGNQSSNTASGVCNAAVTYTASSTGTSPVTVTYTFTGATTGSGSGTGSGSTFNKGNTTVTVTATNACGSDSKSFTVTVTDNQAPILTGSLPGGAQGNVCMSAAPVAPSTASIAALYSDNCGTVNATLQSSSVTGSNCSWTATYTYTIKDPDNNAAANAVVTYTGGDTQAPTLAGTIPSGGSGLNVCFSNIPAGPSEATIAALYTDNCGTVHVTKTGTPSGDNCSWNVTYHYVITDDCNNAATAVDISYSGGDTEAPTLAGTIPSGGSGLNVCFSNIPAGPSEATIAALYTDNCGTVHVTKTGTPSGDNCSWNVTYHYVITDDCNNAATAVDISYSGGDTEAPTLAGTIPSGGSGLNVCFSNIPAGPSEADIAALYTDNCGTVHVTKTGTPSGDNCSWNVTYHYVITDDCNNAATAVDISYSGGDTEAPSLAGTIPSGGSGLNVCFSNIPAGPSEATIAALYTDNCGTVHVTKTGTPSGDNCSWSVTYHYVITDDCNNAATAVDISYSGGDTEAPSLGSNTIPSGGSNLNVCFSNIPAGPSEADIAALYTDNCGTVHVTKTGTPSGDNCSWNVTYHYVITDDCNNAATAVDIPYSGGDTQAPTLVGTIPSSGSGLNVCFSNIPAGPSEATIAALYTDNCGTVHVTKTGTPSGNNCSWNVTYHYVITDDCNNAATAVDIAYSGGDTQAPTLVGTIPSGGSGLNVCFSNIPAGPSEATIAALYTDNCGTVHVTKTGTPSGNNCSWNVTYHYVITDDCNNAATAVDIAYSGGDTQAPTLVGTIPSGGSNLNLCYSAVPAGPSEATIAALYTDNCGTVHVAKTGAPTGNNCSWSVTYHYVITDDCNNAATAVDITYSGGDKTAPVLSGCPPSIINLNSCTTTATWTEPTALDACAGSISVVRTGPGPGSYFAPGSTTVITYKATDPCGNYATCSLTVKRADTLLATVTSPLNQHIYYGFSGDQTMIVKVAPTGGTAPYTVKISLSRKLICNYVNAAGDEVWTSTISHGIKQDTNTVCGGTSYPSFNTQTLGTGLGTGDSLKVTANLLDSALLTICVTDASGCKYTRSDSIFAEDVRCFAGNSPVHKVQLCHRTGSTSNPCVTICVDSAAVAEHLAHGDSFGACPKTGCGTSYYNQSPVAIAETLSADKLHVSVMPNPSVRGTDFNLTTTGKADQQIQIRVMNMLGKEVYGTKGAANQTYKFGGNFISGVYLVEVLHGNEVHTLKVIKQ